MTAGVVKERRRRKPGAGARTTGAVWGMVWVLAVSLPVFMWAEPGKRDGILMMQVEDAAMHFSWKSDASGQTDAPKVTSFRDGQGLLFVSEGKTRFELNGHPGREFWAGRGPLTLAMVVQPTMLEETQSPLCSKWNPRDGLRSFEFGFSGDGRLYWQVSASGLADGRRIKMDGRHGLQRGRPYAVAAVFDPGRRMALYVNGHLSGELTRRIPDRIHENETPVLLGARPGTDVHADAILGDVWIHPVALEGEAIQKWAASLGLTEEPPDGRTEWEKAVLDPDAKPAPIRALTQGPKPHWFGYYDKFQTDPTDRYVLSLEADFDLRVPGPSDVARIGMIDTQDGDKWIPLAETGAWNFQQGCMLQWRPGSDREILYNDREGDRFVCRVLDVKTGAMRTLPLAIDQVHPDGRHATCQDFARAGALRTVVGYAVRDPEEFRKVPAPDDTGIWLMDLDTGEHKLIVSVADIAKIPYPNQKPGDRLYVAHTQWSPDGKRFLFFNRGDTIDSRITTANMDGSDIRVVTYMASHYDWWDATRLLIEIPRRGGFFLFNDDGSMKGERLVAAPPGHHTLLPGREWFLSDTIPQGPDRVQHVYLMHIPTKRFIPLGHFPQGRQYWGDVRCDNHPRLSRDARKVIIDSTHEGTRQMYMIDISGIVGEAPAQ